jgi:plasmid stabilization system protein ParE
VKVINLPAADREFARAVRHLLSERSSSAEAFIAEVDRVSSLLAENPYLGPLEDGGPARTFVLSGFPYRIIYEIRDGVIVVAAFAHHSRRPGYWHRRLAPQDR